MRAAPLAFRLCLVCRSWRTALLASSTHGEAIAGIQPALKLSSVDQTCSPTFAFNQLAQYATKAKRKQQASEEETDEVDINETLQTATSQMSAALQRLEQSLATVRTGRASPGLLDHLPVVAYGERISLQSLAQTSVADAQTLIVTPFDPQTIPAIEKAIVDSALNLSPKSSKSEITVPVPSPTQETLKTMGKMVKQEAEAARVAVRQARKDAVSQAKSLASEDDGKRAEAQVQKLTDRFVEDINAQVKRKEDALEKAL